MKNILLLIVFLSISLISCSNEENETVNLPEESQKVMFGIRNLPDANYDLSNLAYVINDKYDKPKSACNSVQVSVGDKVVILGSTNIVGENVRVKAIMYTGMEPHKEVILHKSSNIHDGFLQFRSCNNPNGTTNLTNPRYWNDENENQIIIIE